MSLSILFPAEHYIGMISSRQGDDLPLAFMTPNGTDTAAQKRRASVDKWVKQNSHNEKHPDPVVMKNEAMAGFRLLDDVHRGSSWGQGSVKWRVEDPRGFELEISSPNLMHIIECSVIDQTEILDLCMWAREGKENILVPVSSDVYRDAMANTERNNKSASLTDLNIGDTAVLKNGVTGIYLGRMRAINADYEYSDTSHDLTTVKLKPRHLFVNHEDRTVYDYASPALAEIIPGTLMSPEDAEKLLYAKTQGTEPYSVQGGSYRSYGYTFAKTPPKVVRRKVEFELTNSYYGTCAFVYLGKAYTANMYHFHSSITASEIDLTLWENETKIVKYSLSNYHRNYFRNSTLAVADLEAAGVKFFQVVDDIIMADGRTYTVRR